MGAVSTICRIFPFNPQPETARWPNTNHQRSTCRCRNAPSIIWSVARPRELRNAELFDAACQIRDAGQSGTDAESRLLARAVADGLGETEARQTIRSAFNGTAREPLGTGAGRSRQPARSHGASPGRLSPSRADSCACWTRAFATDEFVAIAPAADNGDGEIVPRRGVTLTASEWKATGRGERRHRQGFQHQARVVLAHQPDDARTERRMRTSPLSAMCSSSSTATRTASRSRKRSNTARIVGSGLPVSAADRLGQQEPARLVRVDARDAEGIQAAGRRRLEAASRGLNLDKQNRNPSRLSRCPDGWRTVDGEVRRQCAVRHESWRAHRGRLGKPSTASAPGPATR